jgi:hypothetical protein
MHVKLIDKLREMARANHTTYTHILTEGALRMIKEMNRTNLKPWKSVWRYSGDWGKVKNDYKKT